MRTLLSRHATPAIIGGLIWLTAADCIHADEAKAASLSKGTLASASLGMPVTLSAHTIKQTAAGRAQKSLLPDDIPELLNPTIGRAEDIPNACGKDASVICYDYRSGRAVFSSTKQWMPEIEGLTAEGISLRRSRIVFSYRF